MANVLKSEVTGLWHELKDDMGVHLFGRRDFDEWTQALDIRFDSGPGEGCHADSVEVHVTNMALLRNIMAQSGRGYF